MIFLTYISTNFLPLLFFTTFKGEKYSPKTFSCLPTISSLWTHCHKPLPLIFHLLHLPQCLYRPITRKLSKTSLVHHVLSPPSLLFLSLDQFLLFSFFFFFPFFAISRAYGNFLVVTGICTLAATCATIATQDP